MGKPDEQPIPYEAKYRAFYEAGAPCATQRQPDSDSHYRHFLEQQPRGRLIEFGCGEGSQAALAAELGFTVTALDSAPSAIQKARKGYYQHQQLEFFVTDVCQLDDWTSAS